MLKNDVTLCCIVRDEAPSLLEWIAWHKLAGFGVIEIYDNESQDDTARLLARLERAGEISHRTWTSPIGSGPQLPAYRDAVARCGTGWIGFFDIDEFVILPDGETITGLLSRMDAACSAVAFNQRVFGTSARQFRGMGTVIARFTRCATPEHGLHRWIKSVSRTERIASVNSPHGCDLTEGWIADPTGAQCMVRERSWTDAISFAAGHYNHYIVKSVEEYTDKQARGQATEAENSPDKYEKYDAQFFALHDRNEDEDLTAAARLPALEAEIVRLQALCR